MAATSAGPGVVTGVYLTQAQADEIDKGCGVAHDFPSSAALPLSPYAMQHPEHYGLRPTCWRDGKVIHVELTLMDEEGEFIDEAGCNCDLDDPCNNPGCVMERRRYEGNPWR